MFCPEIHIDLNLKCFFSELIVNDILIQILEFIQARAQCDLHFWWKSEHWQHQSSLFRDIFFIHIWVTISISSFTWNLGAFNSPRTPPKHCENLTNLRMAAYFCGWLRINRRQCFVFARVWASAIFVAIRE